MITRVVKLHFEKDYVTDFLTFFESIKHYIVQQNGCISMELLQDENNPEIIFTYSIWENEDFLNQYRDSALFSKVWPTIKPHFKEKAEAWTLNSYFKGLNTN